MVLFYRDWSPLAIPWTRQSCQWTQHPPGWALQPVSHSHITSAQNQPNPRVPDWSVFNRCHRYEFTVFTPPRSPKDEVLSPLICPLTVRYISALNWLELLSPFLTKFCNQDLKCTPERWLFILSLQLEWHGQARGQCWACCVETCASRFVPQGNNSLQYRHKTGAISGGWCPRVCACGSVDCRPSQLVVVVAVL